MIGSRIGHYDVLGRLGAGGMGEVYRARDTKLQRDVAIKVLPPALASDPDRLARLKREAHVLASLNHPHIGGIYGFEDQSGVHALVLELVEGPTLADRIARGPLPLDEALAIARQIADALEAAHEQGIIHRDLKPANIKVRDDGTVKVLDFGLAKIAEPAQVEAAVGTTQSPTITSPAMTAAGMLLGTAAYMSPEQAKGRPADKRSDIWAFGCVLYEMLTGRRAFPGDDVADTLAAVLRSEPALTTLPSDTPHNLREMLGDCFQKDRRERIGDVSTIRFLLRRGRSEASMTPRRPASRLALVGLVFAVAATLAVAAWSMRTASPPTTPQMASRFAIVPPLAAAPAFQGADRDIALSPDGRYIAYRGGLGVQSQIWIRRLDQLEATPLPGTLNARAPFFSPDSKWIGFWQAGVFLRMAVTGGAAIAVGQVSGPPRGASWGDNGIIVATNDEATGLIRLPLSGGEPEILSRPDAGLKEVDHLFPFVLPDRQAVLFTAVVAGATTRLCVFDLQTRQHKTLLAGGSQPELVGDYLVYAAADSLRAVRFDAERLEVTGDPFPVLDAVMTTPQGAANFSISRTGTLLYVPTAFGGPTPGDERTIVWIDRQGREEPVVAPARAYTSVRLAPDETKAAVEIRDRQSDIWILDFKRPDAALRRLTFDRAQEPAWHPDGQFVLFSSSRTGAPNLYRRFADGSGTDERLTSGEYPQFVGAMTSDGHGIGFEVLSTQYLALLTPRASTTMTDGPGAPGVDLARTSIAGLHPRLSPNGRFIAYQASQAGGFEVYVRPYPAIDDGQWLVSTQGGVRPVWSKDGRELFYLGLRDPAVMAVAVDTTGPTMVAGPPKRLFDQPRLSSIPPGFDVAANGRFLMVKEPVLQNTTASSAGMVIVERWLEELKQKMSTDLPR